MSTKPTPAREATRRSGWSSLAWGCAIGCVGLIVVVLIGGLGMWRWATGKSPMPGPEVLLTADVLGYGTLLVDDDDPATSAFLDALLVEMDQDDARQLRGAVPIQVIGALVGDPPHAVALVSLSRFMNLIRLTTLPAKWVDDDEIVRYRDEVIFRDDDADIDMAVSFTSAGMIFGGDVDVAKYAIDRLEEADGAQPSQAFGLLWERTSGAPIRLAVSNERGHLVSVFDFVEKYLLEDELPDDSAARDVIARSSALMLSGQFGAPDPAAIGGTLTLGLPGVTDADAAALALLAEPLRDAFAAEDWQVDGTITTTADGLQVSFQVDIDPDALRGQNIQFSIGQ